MTEEAPIINIYEKCYRKAASIRVIILQDRKLKELQLHNIKISSTTAWKNVTNKGWKALKRKLQRTLHADIVSKGFANFIAKEDRPANARDINLLETIWIIVDVTKYKDPAPQHWTNKGSDYASPGKMTHFGSSHILYLITQKMSEKDILVTNISVVQC